jgi:hypothetical protein
MIDSLFGVDAGRRWAAGALAAQAGEALGKSDRDAHRVLGPILRRVGMESII